MLKDNKQRLMFCYTEPHFQTLRLKMTNCLSIMFDLAMKIDENLILWVTQWNTKHCYTCNNGFNSAGQYLWSPPKSVQFVKFSWMCDASTVICDPIWENRWSTHNNTFVVKRNEEPWVKYVSSGQNVMHERLTLVVHEGMVQSTNPGNHHVLVSVQPLFDVVVTKELQTIFAQWIHLLWLYLRRWRNSR